jgi:hypothetical protein
MKRQENAPPGVPEIISEQINYCPNCDYAPVCRSAGNPRVRIDPEPKEIASRFTICFEGFQANQDISVVVRKPDTTATGLRVHVNSLGIADLDWPVLPRDPVGMYGVFAAREIAGDQVAVTGTFTVIEASGPRLLITPQTGQPGTSFIIALAGFQPGQRVQLRVYRGGGDRWIYMTSLGAQMDGRGMVMLAFRTEGDDRPGSYGVRWDGSQHGPVPFTLK